MALAFPYAEVGQGCFHRDVGSARGGVCMQHTPQGLGCNRDAVAGNVIFIVHCQCILGSQTAGHLISSAPISFRPCVSLQLHTGQQESLSCAKQRWCAIEPRARWAGEGVPPGSALTQ